MARRRPPSLDFGCLERGHFNPLHATVGDPAWQSFWEFLASFPTLELWAPESEPFAIQGDNIGALQNHSKLKGRGPHVQVAKEIA